MDNQKRHPAIAGTFVSGSPQITRQCGLATVRSNSVDGKGDSEHKDSDTESEVLGTDGADQEPQNTHLLKYQSAIQVNGYRFVYIVTALVA